MRLPLCNAVEKAEQPFATVTAKPPVERVWGGNFGAVWLSPEDERLMTDRLLTKIDYRGGELQFAIARIDAQTIDAINILQATHRAMNEALAQLRPQPEHVLVDGLRVNSLRFPQLALVKGDARSFTIAAASILAKVTRDQLMLEYDRTFPVYGFARHKGYGTKRHLAALAEHGPCPIHRRTFAPLKPAQPELF